MIFNTWNKDNILFQDKAVVAVEAAEFHEFEMEHNSSSLLKELGIEQFESVQL